MSTEHRSSIAYRAGLLIVCLLAVAFPGGCVRGRHPSLPKIYQPSSGLHRSGRNPVIFIPGILGSQLVNQKTGETAWPQLLIDEKEGLALPIASTDFAQNRDELVATTVIRNARLPFVLPDIEVYGPFLTALEKYGGYRPGNLDDPPPDGDRDTCYVFAYDWRRDNVESARLLAQKMDRLRNRLGRPDLRFDIIAHSMGGLIARYYAMYGDRDATREAIEPDWRGARNLSRIIMIATPNAGSMDVMQTLIEGYSATKPYRSPIGFLDKLKRKLPLARLPFDLAFTFPSVYQLLPRAGRARFYDEKLTPMSVDIFRADEWQRYGWSAAYNRKFRDKELRKLVKQSGAAEAPARAAELASRREQFLREALSRARAFQKALDASRLPPDGLRFYLFGGDCEPTLDAAVIFTGRNPDDDPRTLFRPEDLPGGKLVRKHAAELMKAPGDGRVTRYSLFTSLLSDGNATQAVPLHRPLHTTFSCELHASLPLELTLQDNLMTVLLSRTN